MNVYVATSRELREEARALMSILWARGHHITYDWVAAIDRNDPDDQCPGEVLQLEAHNDEMGVHNCDALILIAPPTSGTGCFVEFGLARALGKRLIVYGACERSIFFLLRGVECYATRAVMLENL